MSSCWGRGRRVAVITVICSASRIYSPRVANTRGRNLTLVVSDGEPVATVVVIGVGRSMAKSIVHG